MFNDSANDSQSPNHTDVDYSTGRGLRIVTWLALIIMLLAIFINGVCLLLFVREKKLRTNFGIYIIHLTVCDLFYTTFSMGNFIIMNYLEYWPFGITYCAVYKWAEWLSAAAMTHIILITAIDRAFALIHPLDYRQHRGWHSRRMIGRMMLGMYVYLNVCVCPIIIMNWWTQTDPRTCEVTLETELKRWWSTAVNFVNYVFPHVLLIFIYVFIAVKFRERLKRTSGAVGPGAVGQTPCTPRPTAEASPTRLTVPTASQQCSALSTRPSLTANPPPFPFPLRHRHRLEKDRAVFLLFTYLSISMTVCWLPADVFWIWYNIDPQIYQFVVAMVTSLLQYLTAATNPILYQAGNKEMRGALLRLFVCRGNCPKPSKPSKVSDVSVVHSPFLTLKDSVVAFIFPGHHERVVF
ncbi:hypothetical protein BV898_05835 [Hypsibius exemplaris]|uniref:G-protein coupled receptors family 1 profile domain-containing protein n=1 Tax=Hypsibius exemplaris TaxID=2072580 RepID=A0A1W0WYJ2_HYPEX|nr:hypothetical protein BV898_05835 [Hypsibius exemplaris]